MKWYASLKAIRQKNIWLLKRKILLWYESNGLFLSFKLLKKKKKKIIENKPVEFLKTSRYVIPLPRGEEKKKKKKIKFLIGQKFYFLYDHYDTILWEARGLFIVSDYSFYNPASSKNIATFDHVIKFDILWALNHVFRLYVEKSFNTKYLKRYFSTNKLKGLTSIYFKDLFIKYWSPNLPLLWWKGSSFTPKQEGSLMLKAWEIIFRQMVFEELGEEYEFSSYECRIFKWLDIDPFDTNFYWPTHRLYLLGLSAYDGRILNESTDFFIWNYNELGISISNPLMREALSSLLRANVSPPKKVVSPLETFEKTSLNKASSTTKNKDLMTHRDPSYFIWIGKKIQLPNLILPLIKTFFYWWTQFVYLLTKEKIFLSSLDRKIELLKNRYKVFSIFSDFIPTYFYGNFNTFFSVNYFEKISHESKLQLDFFKTEKFWEIFFKHFSLPKYLRYNPVINNFEFLRKKIWNRKENFSVPFLKIIKLLYGLNMDELKKLSFGDKPRWNILPNFLQEFFYLLLQNKLTYNLFYKWFLKPIFNYFETEYYFKLFQQWAFISKCLTLVKKKILVLDKKIIKKDKNPLSYYLHLWESLKFYPNRDDPIFWFQPFGINPFFKFLTLLKNEKTVPFPEAITTYNYYRFKKAKEKKEKEKKTAQKDSKKDDKKDNKKDGEEEEDDDEKKLKKFKVKSFYRRIFMYDVKKWVIHIIRILNEKNRNSASILFFWKLFMNYYFFYSNFSYFSWVLYFWKNFKFYFSFVWFILQFDIDLPSTTFYKFKRHGKIYKQINYKDWVELEWVYDYYKNDYCLLWRDYNAPLKLNDAQKKKVEYFKKYFASTALKKWTNYFVIDNMIILLKLTYFFWYFSCINSVIVNNAYRAYDNNFLLELQRIQTGLYWYQLCLTEDSFYHYLRAYFKLQYYFSNNWDIKILLKKNASSKSN